MTRDEAIRVLKEYIALDEDIDNEYLEAQKVAIRALEEEKQELKQGLKQEPCDDCISREKAKQFLYERIDRLNDDELYDIFSRIIDDMYNELTSVIPTQKWIPVSDRLPDVEYGFSDIYDADGTPLLFECFGSERVLVSYISNVTKKTEMCVSRYSVWKYEDGTRDVSWDSVDFDYEESNPYNLGSISANQYEGGKVIAWMPLPEPYKESEE